MEGLRVCFAPQAVSRALASKQGGIQVGICLEQDVEIKNCVVRQFFGTFLSDDVETKHSNHLGAVSSRGEAFHHELRTG